MIINDVISTSNAVVSAWLPGTAGGDGIVNALIGKYRFRPNGASDRRNTLAFDWPKTQVNIKVFRLR
jgi:beta-glucosidase